MDPFQQEILELIASHDGQYSWYQLDRALSTWSVNRERNPPLLRSLTKVLRELEEQGLLVSEAGHVPSQPVYSITAQGRQAIGISVAVPVTIKKRSSTTG
jgi:DNA-binding HxlR family transcriptional regulator